MENNIPFLDLTDEVTTTPIKTIAFANQKGGVGKTTLCALFANFLQSKGYQVAIVDCDGQQSIFKRREEDRANFPDAKFSYHVQKFDITDPRNAERLIKSARKQNLVVIIDSPGSASQDGLANIITGADIVVCPFSFDAVSYRTTVDFTNLHDLMCAKLDVAVPQRYYIPNRIQPRWGKAQEYKIWEGMVRHLSTKGKVTPRIIAASDIPRFNTKVNTPKQNELVGDAFGFILDDIKDRLG